MKITSRALVVAILINAGHSASAQERLDLLHPMNLLEPRPPMAYELTRCTGLLNAMLEWPQTNRAERNEIFERREKMESMAAGIAGMTQYQMSETDARDMFRRFRLDFQEVYLGMMEEAYFQTGNIETDAVVFADQSYCATLISSSP